MTKVIGRPTRLLLLTSAIVAALAISACGGSSGWSSAQKQKLENELGAVLTVPGASKTIKSDLSAVKDCVVKGFTSKYSPGSVPNSKSVTKELYNSCGTDLKKFESDAKAAEKKDAQKVTSAESGSS